MEEGGSHQAVEDELDGEGGEDDAEQARHDVNPRFADEAL
jgi:hypothetical protein